MLRIGILSNTMKLTKSRRRKINILSPDSSPAKNILLEQPGVTE